MGTLRETIKRKLPDKLFLELTYQRRMGQKLDLNNPVSFNEKMQWLKLYDRNPEHITLVDKYEVKKYVSDMLGSEFVIPLLGVWNHYDEIDFDRLPNRFVLKCTHNSGGIVIVQDKALLDHDAAKATLEKYLTENYYYRSREWPYKDVPPRIIAEEYLENGSEGLHDYKVWCFNGKPEYVQYITGRIGTTYECFYDREWNNYGFHYHNPLTDKAIPRPAQLDSLLVAAEKLAQGEAFVRCDFYVLNTGEIKFGEITFFPMSGFEFWHPGEMDRIMGEKIHLPMNKD